MTGYLAMPGGDQMPRRPSGSADESSPLRRARLARNWTLENVAEEIDLRTPGGHSGAGRYRLDPHLIGTDLWQFHDALQEARHAEAAGQQLAARQKAIALYRGELAEGAGYEWAEPSAEATRHHALDT
jgi:hypothetical protein